MKHIFAVIIVFFLFCPVSVFAETKEISDKDMAKKWFEKGLKYDIDKDYDKAIEAFTKAIALKPDYAYAYTNRGVAYAVKGNKDRAISDYKKACDMGNELGCRNLQEISQNR